MRRVTGIGGVFFKSRDPRALGAWYAKHLGIAVEEWGGAAFRWGGRDDPQAGGTTVWTPFPEDTTHFAPSTASFMIDYRVDDLNALLAALRAEGVEIAGTMEESEYGKFAWVIDLEGNKVELWEAPADR